MAQHYTPIWDDWAEVTQELNDQEKGRLVDAIVAYDNGGNWQDRIKGNERYVFPGYKSRIDRWKETCDNRKSNRTEDNKEEQNEQNKTKKSKSNKTHKDNDNDNVLNSTLKSACPTAKETDRLFDKFWSVYPRHEGKQNAKKAFDKLHVNDKLLETLVSAILKQKQSDQWSDPQYIPHPATWLNGHRWEDEPVKHTGGKKVLAQQYEQREYHEAEISKALDVDDMFTMFEDEYAAKYGGKPA